jgi:hypothetical protein
MRDKQAVVNEAFRVLRSGGPVSFGLSRNQNTRGIQRLTCDYPPERIGGRLRQILRPSDCNPALRGQ